MQRIPTRAALVVLPALLLPLVASVTASAADATGPAQKRAQLTSTTPLASGPTAARAAAAARAALAATVAPRKTAHLSAAAPSTTPTMTAPVALQVVGGRVTLSATSTASTVQFSIDGYVLGPPVAVVDGTATTTWESWGAADGSHTAYAADCETGECGTLSAGTAFTLQTPASDVITAPASGATVGGDVVVNAVVGDDAPAVRFFVDGALQTAVAVQSGAATFTWESAGLPNGVHQLGIAACGSTGYCTAPTTTSVVVANAAPVITVPTQGALVSGATVIRATGPAGGKLFSRNGVPIGFAATAPYAVAVNFSAVADATYSLTVQNCGATAATCGGVTSAARSVRTHSLHPTVSVSPVRLSPNRDGRLESTVVRYRVPEPMGLIWYVTDSAGRVVRGPSSLGQRAVGSYAFTWNGLGSRNEILRNGTYAVRVSASRNTAGLVLRGSAAALVFMDTVAPNMRVTPQVGGVYPVADGFRDRLEPRVALNERAVLTLVVRNAANHVVRVINGVRNPGTTYLSWNGVDSRGRAVPAGTYRYTYIAQDAFGNRRSTPTFSFGLSRARLVKSVHSQTVSAQASYVRSLVGYCSEVDDSLDWPGQGIDLLSRGGDNPCSYDDSSEDLAATVHAFTLPAALSYGPIRLAVTGQSTLDGYDDEGVAIYYTAAGDPTSLGATLGSGYGTTSLPNVSPAYLAHGRTLTWSVGALDGQYWTVRSFTVTWTSYALH